MPDISELNGTAVDNVREFDGLTVTPVPPLLDTYTGAEAAYSVRRLRTAYTGDIMRVRRDSDQNEIDVGFDSNDEFGLTSPVSNASSGGPFTDFADFIGHGGGSPDNGFCRYWYDQSGNANDAEQATQARQPKIYDSSTGIIEEGAVGKEKPALDFLGTTITGLDATGIAMTQPFSGFYTIGDFSTPATSYIHGGTISSNRIIFSNVSVGSLPNLNAGTQLLSASTADVGQNIFSSLYNSTASELWQKGVSVASGNAGTRDCSGLRIGVRYNYTQYTMESTMQEIILYDSDQDAAGNRSGIETNMNGFYNVF